ncbi:hypothetical protein H5410_014803 [Solanum commersonii]|uniref:DUF8040 domain-containing protein n=1 Tax=Solanum commersonii TaxID=4109 RepID=A0A9J5ZSA6_SOLCO|nr:hypothetical protein H5410_014803 [Solanum commersonii]
MACHGHSLRRRCRNRREVRYRMSVRVPKIISHLHYIINDNGSVCIDKLRMDRNAFHTLVLLTKDIGGLTDSKSMSSSEKLAMFLNILAQHEKNRSIKVDYIRSGWSVSQAFNECLSAILKLTPLLLVNSMLSADEAAAFKLRHGRKEEAARLYEQLVKSHGNIEALVGLIQTAAHADIEKAEAYEKQK